MKTRRVETDINREITELLPLALGGRCHVIRQNSGKRGGVRFGQPGMPDLQVMLPGGGSVWLETKRPEGKGPTEEQEAWHAMAGNLQHPVHVVRSAKRAVKVVRAHLDGIGG